ncbi:hypothetical protein EN739_29900 [Mesorhizobium sp. M2A.F.Ca.ET.017.03.2.1]|nr:hypothetical protein EN739_29900 [Mesorhizobium sp. M2A.F.Ca.ET.017.03.2.1]
MGTYDVSNYPVEWQQRYLERDYKNVDPVDEWRSSRGRLKARERRRQRKVAPSMLRQGILASGRAFRSQSGRRLATCPC